MGVAGRCAALPGKVTAFFAGGRFALLPLLLTAAGAALMRGRCYVGYLNDDASFVLLAGQLWRALLSFSAAGLGGSFVHFLPGYPAFLAPFAALAAPDWGLLRWTTAGLSLLSVYALWRLLDGWLTEEFRRWAVLLYAVHPLFLLSSGLVMADPFLAALFVCGLLALRRALEGGGAGWCALLAAASAWAALAKPIGLLLPAALTAALLAARARRPLRWMAALVWLPLAAGVIFAVLRQGTPTDYFSYLLHGLASVGREALWPRLYGLLHSFVLVYGLACPWPRGPVFDLAGAGLIAGAGYLSLRGLAALLAGPAPVRFTALAAGLLLLGQGLVMSVWTVHSERYVLPMLPLGLPLLTAGISSLLRARPAAARALLAAAALYFFAQSARLALVLNSGRRPQESRLCSDTLAWIRAETGPDSRFSGNGDLVRLYTGRAGFGLSAAPDADLFLVYLARLRVTHALVTDLPVLSTRGPYSSNHALQKAAEKDWIRGHPGLFEKLYSNQAEKTEIYAVRTPGRWLEAAGLYAEALAALRRQDQAAAEAGLRAALAAVPDFPSALALLASLRLPQPGGAAEAERLLRRALVLEPNYPRASQALAALLERQGRAKEALAAKAAAAAALSKPAFSAAP